MTAVRHSRAAEYEAALASTPAADHWSELASDPNDPATVAHRAGVLAAAWRDPIADRVGFLEQRAAGRNVLDIGCVAHDASRLDGPDWLHGRIARSADRCVGVDILEDGVEAVRAAGYDAVVHDLTTGLGPLASRGPFDVIVAGELIEHVPNLDMLFAVAAEGLAADGQLVITTPNPFAPARVRAGQLGIAWENVDHITYAFPSGIAELADRHGLVLREAATTADQPTHASPIRWLKRSLRGSHWRTVGYTTVGERRQTRVDGGWLARRLQHLARPTARFVGETFVYVIGRPNSADRRGHSPTPA